MFPKHPFAPGLYVSVYNHPYMLSLRLHEVIPDPLSAAVLLLWRHSDIVDCCPVRDLRKGWYGCHILLGEGVADYRVHDRLCQLVGCPRPSVVFVEGHPYFTLDYGITPEAGYDQASLVSQLRIQARAERDLLGRLSGTIPQETLTLPGD